MKETLYKLYLQGKKTAFLRYILPFWELEWYCAIFLYNFNMLWGPIPSSLQVGFVFFYPFMIIYLTLIFMDITDSEMYVLKKKKKNVHNVHVSLLIILHNISRCMIFTFYFMWSMILRNTSLFCIHLTSLNNIVQ